MIRHFLRVSNQKIYQQVVLAQASIRKLLNILWFGSDLAKLKLNTRIIRNSGLFDEEYYLQHNPEIEDLDMPPLKHFVLIGAKTLRNPSLNFDLTDYVKTHPNLEVMGLNPVVHLYQNVLIDFQRRNSYSKYSVQQTKDATSFKTPLEVPSLSAFLLEDCTEVVSFKQVKLSNFMFYIWRARPDLQLAFDIKSELGQIEFCCWYLRHAYTEYKLPNSIYSDAFLWRMNQIRRCKSLVLKVLMRKALEKMPCNTTTFSGEVLLDFGCNVIGYATRIFGMGQQTRTSARAIAMQGFPLCVIDYEKIYAGGDYVLRNWISINQRYKINLFNIYADSLPIAYTKYGDKFFSSGYNIGYWGWELSICPEQFDLAFMMVDEVWAISEFTCEALRSRSPVPVRYMPLAVEKPKLCEKFSKSDYGLSDKTFVFLFIFDAASYMQRKNPVATVRAFKKAFPEKGCAVSLVMKTMNVDHADKTLWMELCAEVSSDERITIITERYSNEKLTGLYDICDAFVSLHRSEGFGLCIAEAMLFGKPVVATNYSGSLDFANKDTACVVDYELIDVAPNAYIFSEGKQWANPNIEHAAFYMKRLFEDEDYRQAIGICGQQYVENTFNMDVCGQRYVNRLKQIVGMI